MGRRSNKIYVFGDVAFVQNDAAPFWLRVHACVVKVPCTACGAVLFEACRSTTHRNRGGHVGYTHYQRRAAARGKSIPTPATVMVIPKA